MATVRPIWTIVVAGGSGTRFGAPKQYLPLGDERVIDRALRIAREVSDGVVAVVPVADAAREGAIAGGATRRESVAHGLAAVPDDAATICVHDAARPFATVELYRAVIAAIEAGADAAIPALAVTDTIKQIDSPVDEPRAPGRPALPVVVRTLDRASLVAVQTPQAFRARVLRDAHRELHDTGTLRGIDASAFTDDASMVEACGGRVVVVPGEADNRKITHPDDLEWARRTVDPR